MNSFLHIQMDYLLLLQNFRIWSGGIFDSLFSHITMCGEYEFGMMFTAFIYWIVNKNYGIFMVWNLFVGLLANQFLKVTACIYRPWILDNRIHPIKSAMEKAGGYSFPSGHTAIATGTMGALAKQVWTNKKGLAIFLIIMALLVAFSRNYLGVHTPQDVIVSLIIGTGFIFLTGKILNWVQQGKNRDLIAWSVIILLCAILIIYTELKNYPIDYINNTILVDPMKMKYESFPKGGFIAGAFTGLLLERRFINFEIPKTFLSKVFFYLIGGSILLYLIHSSGAVVVNLKNYSYWGRFTNCFIVSLFLTAIYPAIIKIYYYLKDRLIKQ